MLAIVAAVLLPCIAGAQDFGRVQLDVAVGGGNVGGGGNVVTAAKLVGGLTLTTPLARVERTFRPVASLSTERYFGNEGGSAPACVSGGCFSVPPAIIGAVLLGGAEWIPLAPVTLTLSAGGGYFHNEQPNEKPTPAVIARGSVGLRIAPHDWAHLCGANAYPDLHGKAPQNVAMSS